MLKKIISLSILIFTLSLSNPVLAQGTVFTPSQRKILKVLNLPVISAGWIPKGFKLNRVKVELITQENPGGISNYELIYEGDYGKRFEIFVQNGGIGDVPETPNLKLKTLFGQVDVYVNSKCVSTGWIEYKNRGYMFYGCDSQLLNRNIDPSPISKDDAIKIIKNLTLLK